MTAAGIDIQGLFTRSADEADMIGTVRLTSDEWKLFAAHYVSLHESLKKLARHQRHTTYSREHREALAKAEEAIAKHEPAA